MSRIRRGWELTKKSWAVLRDNRELIRFPLYGGVATIVMAIIVVGPGLYLIEDDSLAAGAPLIVVGLYLLAVIGTFFSVGLAHCANEIFMGRPTTVGNGVAFAREHLRQILGWAALSTTVGVIFSLLENQGIVGQIIGRLLDIAWSLVTFLAVPVIAIEGTGPIETFKRSASLFKERWGQQITGNIAIGGLVALLGFIPAVILVVAGIAIWASAGFIGALLVLLGIALFVVSMLISSALGGIFGVALYHYALEGQSVGGFTTGELESAVKLKRGATAPGTI